MARSKPTHQRAVVVIFLLHLLVGLGLAAVSVYAHRAARRIAELRTVKVEEENRNRQQIKTLTDIEALRAAALKLQDRSTKDRDTMERLAHGVDQALFWAVGVPLATVYLAGASLYAMRRKGRQDNTPGAGSDEPS